MTQITFIISGGTPDYTVSIEGYVGTPMEWIFDAPGEYTIEVEEQESYKLLIEDSEGCLSENYFEYTRPSSLINYDIIVTINFTDSSSINIKNMSPQEACDALLLKCGSSIYINGTGGGVGQIAHYPPLINDVVYAYWHITSTIKYDDGTYILSLPSENVTCAKEKYIARIENGIIVELVLCTPPYEYFVLFYNHVCELEYVTTTTTTLPPD